MLTTIHHVQSPTHRQFAVWIERAMRAAGIGGDNVALAHRMGTSENNVGHWVRGNRLPGRRNCYALAKALGVDPLEVLEAAGHIAGVVDLAEEPPRRRREDVAPPTLAGFPSPQSAPYEGGAAPLTSTEIIALRAMLLRAFTAAEVEQVREFLPALTGMTAAEMSLIRAMARVHYQGEGNGAPPR